MSLVTFQGARLEQAREVRQITATLLAERVGASVAAVTAWERGAQPRSAARQEIARVLELPEAYFLRPPSPTAPAVFRFRSLASSTKRARAAAVGRVKWLHEIFHFVDMEVSLPRVDVPELDVPADPERLTGDDIEEAARETRKAWGLRDGPIPDVCKLLESRGVILARLALNAAELDGLSSWSSNGRPYVVLNTEKASCVRSRFDAAHELAHLVLHRHAPEKPESAVHKLMEMQAHRFAGAFIFPKTAAFDEVTQADLDSLVQLKARWRLSIGAMIFRLFQLGMISESRKESLQRQMGARGWRSWEPLDSEIPVERPIMLCRAYELLCGDGGWKPADITRVMPLADHDHELLAGLPARWMQGQHQDFGELVALKPSASPPSHATATGPAHSARVGLPRGASARTAGAFSA